MNVNFELAYGINGDIKHLKMYLSNAVNAKNARQQRRLRSFQSLIQDFHHNLLTSRDHPGHIKLHRYGQGVPRKTRV